MLDKIKDFSFYFLFHVGVWIGKLFQALFPKTFKKLQDRQLKILVEEIMKLSNLIPANETAWVSFIGDFRVLLRHTDEVMARKIREDSTDKFKQRKRFSDIEDVNPKLLMDAYAKNIILNWEGIFEEDDITPFPCTDENKKMFIHKNLDFQRWVVVESGNIQNFLAVGNQEEEEKK